MWKDRLERLLKFRFAILYPFVALFVIYFSSSDNSLRIGAPIILAGLLIRVWANCYAIKMNKLTTSGPYAHLRHPLYFGTMTTALGFAIMLQTALFGVLFVLVVTAVYWRTIKIEEKMLLDKFGEDYARYKREVPAFFPRITSYSHGEKWPPSLERLVRSKEYKLFIWMLFLVAFFYLKEEILVEKEVLGLSEVVVLALAILLALIDIFSEVYKKRKAAAV